MLLSTYWLPTRLLVAHLLTAQRAPTVLRWALPCCLVAVALCASAVETPDRASLNRSLVALEQKADGGDKTARQRQDLQAAIGFLDDEERSRKRLKLLQQEWRQAPARIVRAEQTLANLAPIDSAALTASADGKDIATLTAELSDDINALEKLQGDLADANNQLALASTLPERAQSDLGASLKRMEAIRSELDRAGEPGDSATGATTDAAQQKMAAEMALLTASIALRQLELQANQSLQELAVAQRELLRRQIADQELVLDVLQKALNRKRREHTEKALAEATTNSAAVLPNSALLAGEQEANRTLGERLLAITDRNGQLLRESITVTSDLEQARQTARLLEDQISALSGSLLLSEVLYEQYQSLPSVRIEQQLAEEIGDLRLEQFRLARQRDALLNPADSAERLLVGVAEEERTPALREALLTTLAIRQDLLSQLDAELNRLFNLAINVQINQDQLLDISRSVRSTIEEHMFWIPGARRIGEIWLLSLPVAVYDQVRALAPVKAWQVVTALPAAYWSILAPPLFIAGLLLFRHRRIVARLDALNAEIGRLRDDSQRHTPFAILLCLLLALPGPLVLAGAGLLARAADYGLASAVLLKLAVLGVVIGLCRRLLRTHGVAGSHFSWPAESVRSLRRLITSIGAVLAPLIIVIALGARAPVLLANDRIGQLVLMLLTPLLALLVARASLIYPRQRLDAMGEGTLLGIAAGNRMLRNGTALTLAGVLLVLAVLTGLGYYYTAIQLASRLVDSFYLLLLWILTSSTALRGLAVAARRLNYRRAIAQREAEMQAEQTQREGAEAVEVVPEPPLDMQQVGSQSLRLTRLMLVIVFGVILYWVWSDLIGAFAYTDTIVLWERIVGEGGVASIDTTSLRDLLVALVMLVITAMLARNLPGLLEVMVLARLELPVGSTYAITSLLSYAIVAVGALAVLSVLGAPWDRLQWLVAALGVGLGFGLQEIFANFVSGLIILFERPVRIGDVITIGDLTGTVSRIRIRATTITDFDRKEIIVPNKGFVTDRLINWTLTDSVTRVVIKVGFAYGTDLGRAKQVLLDVANENPRVMKEPAAVAPVALFLSFGASTLDHELRAHVRELADRLPGIDELNRRIAELCRERGIEIAYPQLDIRVRSSDIGKGDGTETPGDAAPAR
ncbi:MAG: mechanosensitive channel MscK [Porticoccaceae bacterium]